MSLFRPTPPPFVAAANRFAFDLRAELGKEDGNLVFSPASIAVALAMTWHGAVGATRDEISEVLHFSRNAEDLAREAGTLAAALQAPDRGVTLAMANRLFGASGYTFEPPFLDAIARAFGAPLAPVDFAGDPEGARGAINRWVEEVTRDCVRELLAEGTVTSETRLALVNAVYFLGDWAEPFDKTLTSPRPFWVRGRESKPVSTMTRTGAMRTARANGAQLVELPYVGGTTAMVIAMPDAPDGLDALEASLDAQRFTKWLDALADERIALALPKVELRPARAISLTGPLAERGMKLPFDAEHADFTAMANPPDPADRLYISAAVHKAFVRMDEKGTEAAAASAFMMTRAGGPPPKRPRAFDVDRPYLFFLVDRQTSWILFMGRVVDPTSAG